MKIGVVRNNCDNLVSRNVCIYYTVMSDQIWYRFSLETRTACDFHN